MCAACLADFSALRSPDELCPLCALPSPGAAICLRCLREPPPSDGLYAVFDYREPLKRLLTAWKYGAMLQYSASLCELLLSGTPPFLKTCAPVDFVLPMPVSRQRLTEHGFDHSLILAEAAADFLRLPILPADTIVRAHRPPQARLSQSQRQSNVRHAFNVVGDVRALRLLVIDDVCTTGATLRELAGSLKKAGAEAVYAWTLAHTRNFR